MSWPRIVISIALLYSATIAKASQCGNNEVVPIVRNISEIGHKSFGFHGLSHMTMAGSLTHGFKEVEVWLETLAPGSGTPIHRHSCEEIFIVLKGSGTVYLAPNTQPNKYPGVPTKYPIFANSTFHIPVDAVHQVSNTNEHDELHFIVVISRPPMKVFIYDDWVTPHDAAKSVFPMPWDGECYRTLSTNDEL